MTWETSDMQAVFERLKKLERHNRRLKGAGLLSLVLVSGIVLMGQATPKSRTVEANEFILSDSNGRRRAILSLVGEAAALALSDEKGITRALLVVDKNGASFNLADANKTLRTSLALGKDGQFLILRDADGGVRATISVGENGPLFSISDKDGFRAELGSTSLVTPSTGETHKTSAASIVMFNKDGKVIWRAP